MLSYDVSIKYMFLGYGIILGLLSAYIINLMMRWKKKKREYLLLRSRKDA